jgi:hypothetical protein
LTEARRPPYHDVISADQSAAADVPSADYIMLQQQQPDSGADSVRGAAGRMESERWSDREAQAIAELAQSRQQHKEDNKKRLLWRALVSLCAL